MKYLYTNSVYMGIHRYPIIRETDANIWIKVGNSETKISKRTYRTGSGYSSVWYKEETPELKAKYEKAVLLDKYQKKLESLEKCTDEKVIDQVLKIEIPDNQEGGK